MKQISSSSSVTIIAAALLALLLSGCSGSSSPGAAALSAEPSSELDGEPPPPPPPISLTGTLIIDERSGKRFIDAYFTRSESHQATLTPLWSDATNTCFEPQAVSDAAQGNGLSDLKLERAVERIDIASRAGNYVTLMPQQLGETVVYASDARWQDEALPVDALLTLTASQGYTSVEGIGLSPLLPLERLSPADGQLLESDSAVRWQGAPDDDTTIRLQVAGIGEQAGLNTEPVLAMVQCTLADDGAFDLPDSLRVALGNPRYLTVALARHREQQVNGVEGELRIVQMSQN